MRQFSIGFHQIWRNGRIKCSEEHFSLYKKGIGHIIMHPMPISAYATQTIHTVAETIDRPDFYHRKADVAEPL